MNLRITWVQPEDLVGHELAQAAQDGRDASAVAARWAAAGGNTAALWRGASAEPAGEPLRALACELLDELAALRPPSARYEPSELPAIRAACPDWPADEPGAVVPGAGVPVVGVPAGAAVSPDRIAGAWLGRAAGCLLGKPVEKIPREGIEQIARATGNWPITGYFTAAGLPAELAGRWPWNRRSATTSLAENIDGMPEDDDLNYPLLALLTLERNGRGFTTADVAKLWLDELPAGRTFTAERVAYRNLLLGIEPPATARYRNPFREWIGAQIRTDPYGWVNPGRPGAAAELAYRDAALTHTANGLYGAMFTAALAAAACSGHDVPGILATARRVLPPRSRMAAAAEFGVRAADSAEDGATWDVVNDALHDAYGHLHWVHAINNTALVAAALTFAARHHTAPGEVYTAALGHVVAGGWDTDSAGATVGGVLGALYGAAALPPAWIDPLHGRLATTVAGLGSITFAELTRRTLALVDE